MFHKMNRASQWGIGVSASVLGFAMVAQPALASEDVQQGSDQVADAYAGNSGDIIVTAQRKEEALSRVPVSVLAFDSEALVTRGISSEQDLGSIAPGLVVKNGQNSNQLSFSMRGQTLDPFSGTSPAVLPYLNEAPFTAGNSASAFFDFASIQVLKGPQGTLFGRNATGGAILYSTVMPGDEVGGYIRGRFGERKLVQFQGAIDLPLEGDKFAVRLAGDFLKQDGYIRNINTGNTLGDKDSQSGRITIAMRPTENFENISIFQYSRVRGTEGVGGLYSYYTEGQTEGGFPLTSVLDSLYGPNSPFGNLVGDGPAGPGTWPGGVAGYLAFQRANPYDVWLQHDLPHKANLFFGQNITKFDVSDTMTIKNIFSIADSFSRAPGNLAGSPFGALWLFNNSGTTGLGNGAPGGQTFDVFRVTNELQLQGSLADDRLDYILGGFYSSATNKDYIPVHVGADLPTSIADIAYFARIKNESKALFGQLTYKLTDRLTMAAGGRYSWEKVSLEQLAGSIFAGSPSQSRKLSDPSWTFNLQYQATPSTMIYAAQRGSFRSGNFNGTVVPTNDLNFFGNENTYDFEGGIKFSGWLGSMRSSLNIAVYHQVVKDAQHAIYALVGGNPAGFTVNVPEAKVSGVEVDGMITPANWLSLGFTAAYTDARYTKNIVDLSSYTGIPNYVIPFDSYPDSPKWAGTVFVEVKLPVDKKAGEISLRADGSGQSSIYFSNNNYSITPQTKLDGYFTVDLRASWKNVMNSGFSAAAFARNIGNRRYYASGYVMGAAGGYNTAYPGEPRTFGAELSFEF